jgi:radical SAM-linked protein
MQRLRVVFARGDELKYVAHLDMARLWERAVRRSRLPLAYSSGFTPHPRITFAAPLAVGVTAGHELMDLQLAEPVAPAQVRDRLNAQLPPGLKILEVVEEDSAAASLQARLRAVEYEVTLREGAPHLAEAVAALLAKEQIPFERVRDGKVKVLDLRPFIEALGLPTEGEGRVLSMRLRVEASGAIRPDEVLAALGISDDGVRIHRSRVVLAE